MSRIFFHQGRIKFFRYWGRQKYFHQGQNQDLFFLNIFLSLGHKRQQGGGGQNILYLQTEYFLHRGQKHTVSNFIMVISTRIICPLCPAAGHYKLSVNNISIVVCQLFCLILSSCLPISQLKNHYLINHNCESVLTKLEGLFGLNGLLYVFITLLIHVNLILITLWNTKKRAGTFGPLIWLLLASYQ